MTLGAFRSSDLPAFLALSLSSLGQAGDLRPLSTDRPDTTESPHTVDVGHFQFEMEIANATRDGKARELNFGELNLKMGMEPQTDFQIVMPFYAHVQNGAEGYGDTEIRLKRNLWGNDEGATAFAIMPFVRIPTANPAGVNRDFEGGIMAPFSFDGPGTWSCAAMGELDFEANADGKGHHWLSLISATVGHAMTEKTRIFLELVAIQAATSHAGFEAYFNGGMTWAITPTWQLDGGARTSLTTDAVNFTPFLGVSTKF